MTDLLFCVVTRNGAMAVTTTMEGAYNLNIIQNSDYIHRHH